MDSFDVENLDVTDDQLSEKENGKGPSTRESVKQGAALSPSGKANCGCSSSTGGGGGTTIYRYYSTPTENLSPRKGVDYDGLSFMQRTPKPGVESVSTTIENVNNTGVLKAIVGKGGHVTLVPTNGTVLDWMEQGMNSLWSQMLASIVEVFLR